MKYNIGQEVILHDPASGKPVNYGVIKGLHNDQQFYAVTVQRLNNKFEMNWHEELVKPSTPELFKQQTDNLDRVEQLSAHLIDYVNFKYIDVDQTLDIPATFALHSYLARYFKMDIEGKKLWRLLTYQEYSIKVELEDIIEDN